MQEHLRVSDLSNKGNFPPEGCLLCGHQESTWDALSGPGLIKTPCCQCRGYGFDPCWGKITHALWHNQKSKSFKFFNKDSTSYYLKKELNV